MLSRDGSVDGSRSASASISSITERESKTEELIEDCESTEVVETLDGVLTRLEDDELNDKLVGV